MVSISNHPSMIVMMLTGIKRPHCVCVRTNNHSIILCMDMHEQKQHLSKKAILWAQIDVHPYGSSTCYVANVKHFLCPLPWGCYKDVNHWPKHVGFFIKTATSWSRVWKHHWPHICLLRIAMSWLWGNHTPCGELLSKRSFPGNTCSDTEEATYGGFLKA